MRISDWSSDVCSSDLTAPSCQRSPKDGDRHRAREQTIAAGTQPPGQNQQIASLDQCTDGESTCSEQGVLPQPADTPAIAQHAGGPEKRILPSLSCRRSPEHRAAASAKSDSVLRCSETQFRKSSRGKSTAKNLPLPCRSEEHPYELQSLMR